MMGWRMIQTESSGPTETCPHCWWPSRQVWLMGTNVSSHENPGVEYSSSQVFKALVYNYRILNKLLKTPSLGKFPFKNTYNYRKVNIILKCSILDICSPPMMWLSDKGWGSKARPVPCSCPQGQSHKGSHRAFEKPAKGWGVSEEGEPSADRDDAKSNCPL